MNRKRILKTSIVIMTISYIMVAVNNLAISEKGMSNMMLENVEALSQSPEPTKEYCCEQKSTYCYPKTKCPICGQTVGFIGTKYSCGNRGSSSECTTGEDGVTYICTQYAHGESHTEGKTTGVCPYTKE